ncbi:MAG: secondary thiamine-phosphate synthase enzyme YjbQ [Planctomycetota bacterium]|jgi:secondary thiamine-phosphate synthase enzyme
MQTLSVRTGSKTEFIDITSRVQQAVAEAGLQDGICMVFVPHTTAAVTINENADPSVTRDILKELNKIVPFDDNYAHLEGNSAAHVKSSMVGCSCVVPVEGGRLALGTWQGIYFCEFDGPRSRKVWVNCGQGVR